MQLVPYLVYMTGKVIPARVGNRLELAPGLL